MKSFFLVFAVLFLAGFSSGEENSCITTDCHQNFKKYKSLHSPVEEDCTNCHEKVDKHKFKFDDRENLCIQCHDDKKEGKIVHEAVASGACTDCHDPHGNNFKSLLKEARIDNVCFECHDKDEMTKKFIHGPNQEGDCTICHDVHVSKNKKLLKSPQGELCTGCHDDKDFSGKGKHMHSPLKKGCSQCHNPHSSDFEYQMVQDSGKICERCHDKIFKKAGEVKFKHKILFQKGKCNNCHDAHGSSFDNNLKEAPGELCLNCHKEPIKKDGNRGYNIFEVIKKGKHKHGPVEDGECTACHDPHGSDYFRILQKDYPEKFYTSYDRKKYGLCFECHESSLARTAKTVALTEFRDGSRNLHFVHVNKKKGRTCRVCHEVHASAFEKQIRKETPFGKWNIPLGFKKIETGGSCAPGCHKPYTYLRDKKLRVK